MGIKTYNSTKGFHDTSISTLFDNRFRKRYRKIQIQTVGYNM